MKPLQLIVVILVGVSLALLIAMPETVLPLIQSAGNSAVKSGHGEATAIGVFIFVALLFLPSLFSAMGEHKEYKAREAAGELSEPKGFVKGFIVLMRTIGIIILIAFGVFIAYAMNPTPPIG